VRGETTYKSVINFAPKNVRSLVGNGVKMDQTRGTPAYAVVNAATRSVYYLLPIYDSSESCLTPMADVPDSEISILLDTTASNPRIAINIAAKITLPRAHANRTSDVSRKELSLLMRAEFGRMTSPFTNPVNVNV